MHIANIAGVQKINIENFMIISRSKQDAEIFSLTQQIA